MSRPIKEVDEKLMKYPATKKFRIIDTIGVPHPYCIGSKHVEHAADNFCGILGEAAIESAERKGIVCDICRQIKRKTGKEPLKYHEHKKALLVEVDDDRDLKEIPELKDYLLSIKEMAIKDNYEGFAFIKASDT